MKQNSQGGIRLSQGHTDSNLPHICSAPESDSTLTSENTLRLSSMKVTALPFNKEVRLPEVMESREEVNLAAYKTEVLELVRKYTEENCSSEGKQAINISEEESQGIQSLKRRCKGEDLVIMETDKSKRLSPMTKENYVAVTEPHIVDDRVVSENELKNIENILNAHTCQISRSFNLCYEQGDFRRIKQAITNASIIPPPLRSLRKDHKKVSDDMVVFGPSSRPVGNGNNAPDSQLSWLLATICQKAADSLCSPSECISTEDMLSSIDLENSDDLKPAGQVIISMDAVALYPSLEAEDSARVCAELITTSGLRVESIDWEEVGLYVTVTGHDGQFSNEIIPQRRYTAGAKPSITTSEIVGPLQRDKNKSKFLSPARLPSHEEKNELLAVLLHTAIKTLMTNHTYSWKGEVRIQSKGGGIGDKLAQAAARLYMI